MTIKELYELANKGMEKTAGVAQAPTSEEATMIKTAEEEMANFGRILGTAMAEAFIEKLAEAQAIPAGADIDPVPDIAAPVEAKAPAAMGVDPQNIAPQQIPTQNLEAETMEAGAAMAMLRKMTPSEIVAFINAQSPDVLETLSQDPEIASILDNAIAQVEAAPAKAQAIS